MNKKNLAIIGCSYTNHRDSNSLFNTYPALIAKHFPDYFVIDLSVPGSSNCTAYLRLKWYEERYNTKIDKVIFQITHLYRTFLHSKTPAYNMQLGNINLFEETYVKDNYFYSNGVLDNKNGMHFSLNSSDPKIKWIYKYFPWYFKKAKDLELGTTWKSHWETLQMINLIDRAYDTVFFHWHNRVKQDLDSFASKGNYTYAGCVEEWLGADYFETHGKAITYHFGAPEQHIIFEKLRLFV